MRVGAGAGRGPRLAAVLHTAARPGLRPGTPLPPEPVGEVCGLSPFAQIPHICGVITSPPDPPPRWFLVLGKVAAGFPSPAESLADRCLDLHAHLVQHPAATFCFRASGDSMQDEDVLTGAILVVNRSVSPRPSRLMEPGWPWSSRPSNGRAIEDRGGRPVLPGRRRSGRRGLPAFTARRRLIGPSDPTHPADAPRQ